MQNQNLIITIILVILVGAGGFFGGIKYQQSKQSSNFSQFQQGGSNLRQGQGQRQARAGGQQGFRPVNGEILSSDDKSITVKLPDGSSKIVILTGTTTINKAAEATKADLQTGEKVAVFGTNNSDGSVNAQNIQINPIMRGNLPNQSPNPSQ